MQTLLLYSFLIALFALASCQDMGTARFIVMNMGRTKVDSLYFMPSDSNARRYLLLEPGEEQRYNLSMAGLRTDGAYGIMFKKGEEKITTVFGYFSNGAALEKYTIVKILDDTLIFNPKY